jgi:hypothetical protein
VSEPAADPRPAAITFVTTEHFTLQGSRAATIAESTGRATMFLASVSGALVALGLIATAAHIGTAFYAFAFVVLPALVLVGLMTFERVVQNGVEDFSHARRIAQLRAYYFDNAPELVAYLMSVPPDERLRVQGIWGTRLQGFRTIAGMIAVITAVLVGTTVGLAMALAAGHSIAAGVATGIVVACFALVAMMRYQRHCFESIRVATLFEG